MHKLICTMLLLSEDTVFWLIISTARIRRIFLLRSRFAPASDSGTRQKRQRTRSISLSLFGIICSVGFADPSISIAQTTQVPVSITYCPVAGNSACVPLLQGAIDASEASFRAFQTLLDPGRTDTFFKPIPCVPPYSQVSEGFQQYVNGVATAWCAVQTITDGDGNVLTGTTPVQVAEGMPTCPPNWVMEGTASSIVNGIMFVTDVCQRQLGSSGVFLFDPIADNLASGSGLVSNPTQLAAASHAVQGLAADSATQVLVEVFFAGMNVGDTINLTLSDENGPSSNSASAGYLTALTANGMDSRTSNGVISIQAVSIPSSGAVMGFAVFHAPTDFVRALNADDPTASARTVSIAAADTNTGSTNTTDVAIVRPPVVFIHGLWGSPSDFMSSDGGVLGAFTGQVQWKTSFARFDQQVLSTSTDPNYVDPQVGVVAIPGNTLGFLYAATQVLPQVRAAVADYKYSSAAGGQIAATQVDVVAHSMGGVVTRTLPLLSGYAGQDTYTQGYVHKLITLDTPHTGTPVAADALLPANSCVQQMLAIESKFVIKTAVVNNASVNGAVADLQVGSKAITNLQNLPTAMIGGQMTPSQLGGAGQNAIGATIRVFCGTAANDPLANALNPIDWFQELQGDSDGVVPLTSQFNGNLGYSVTTAGASQNTFPAIHSKGIASLGFLPPTILDQASGAPTQVVNLLNTPVTNSVVFLGSP
jgi:hypothetical protein